MISYTQEEFLEIIKKYNGMDRRNITINLSTVYKKAGIKAKNIIEELGYSSYKIHSWTAMSSPNVPTFEDGLLLAVKYGFDIKDLIKE